MSPERWQQINQLFEQALAEPAARRAAFVAQACAGDAALRDEVLSLLAVDDKGAFVEQPLSAVAADLMSDLPGDATLSSVVIGATLGGYQVLRELGRGGMGEVYLAQEQKLKRRVALKLLPARFTHDAERLHRFRQEARAASALNHPNIVTIFDIGEDGGRHFMATEYVEGRTLRDALQNERLTPAQALDIAAQVASALAAAHQAGIIHRDIKPENLMLRPDGYVKVLDFGLAKLTERTADDAAPGLGSDASAFDTRPGAVLGTVAYMSPEQARGQKVDARTDLFSLGVVLYEMLAGVRPFDGATRDHTLVAILDEEPPPLAATLPEGLPLLVSRMLAKERAARLGTAQELLGALRQLKDELVAAEIRSSDKLSGAAVAAHSPAQAPSTFARRKLGVFAVVALLAVVSWLGWRWLTPRTALHFASHERLQLSKLTNSGLISAAYLTPDGRFAAYFSGNRELWISQLADGSARQLLPATDGYYTGLSFARDSASLYYCHRLVNTVQYALYQIPVLGGAPRKVLEGVRTLAVSPVDGRLVMQRSFGGKGPFTVSLTQPDGSDERPLITIDYELDQLAWSPDGERVAFSRLGRDERGFYWDLGEWRVADGREHLIVPRNRYEIDGLAWLPGDEGLLFCAEDEAKGVRQIWRVDARTGARRNVTNNLNNYYGLSLSADGSKLLTAVQDRPCRLYTAPYNDPTRVTPLPLGVANYRETAWLPDGRLIYSLGVNGQYDVTGQRDLWVTDVEANPSPGQPQRVTSDQRGNWMQTVSADGRYVVYVSRRSGGYNLWRCEADGSHTTQLTFNGGTHPRLTPDGQWVIYCNQSELWKIPVAGGTPVNVAPANSTRPDVSPDGKWLVYQYLDRDVNEFRVAVRELAGTTVRQTFAIRPAYEHLRWAPDGRGLLFINDAVNGVYLQPLDGPLRKLYAPPPGELVYAFSTSPDGQRIAYTVGTRTSDLVLLTEAK